MFAKRPKRTARNAMMDLLARRDHSEKELRKKLKDKFLPEEIDKAISFAKDRSWIPDSDDDKMKLAEKTAGYLHRRGKGIRYINQQLQEKGLPRIKADSDLEYEKALQLVKNKFTKLKAADREAKNKQQAKIGRFLASRGFDMSIVRKVIYEEF